MIIDSHTHYVHRLYEGEFPYLNWAEGEFFAESGDRNRLFTAMKAQGIVLCIEPATALEKIEAQLAVADAHWPYLRMAVGVHPKHCADTAWEDRHQLPLLAQRADAVAIGETGLDYSVPPEALDKECQKKWFSYQLQLAQEMHLPLILHIRDAYDDALEMLQQHALLRCGGVAHCFSGDLERAMACVELGFALGIGGRVLQDEQLQQTVRYAPLSSILVETDAPYIRPDIRHLPGSGKQRKKIRNSSLILHAVIEKIAQLKALPAAEVEAAIYQNTLRVFRLEQPAGTE